MLNFRLLGSAERRLVFDINDFDETLPGPWEWDVKRLATSIVIAGRANGYPKKVREKMVRAAVRSYREAMHRFADMGNLEVWYHSLDATEIQQVAREQLAKRGQRRLSRTVAQAKSRDNLQVFEKLTAIVDGQRRIVADPPLVVPVDRLLPELERQALERTIADLLDRYASSLSSERRHLLAQYRFVDMARKVVGVGSVGTRCYLLVLRGPADEPLLLQIKQAGPSVLESHGGEEQPGLGEPGARDREGRRVMAHQRILQAVTDPFLGHFSGRSHDYYVRQYHDMKGSIDLRRFSIDEIRAYVRTCGTLLARAHAQSEHVTSIAAYLDDSHEFDRAVGAWSLAYAAQMAEDHAAVLEAVGG
jgi:uncharacterized protein (DUF2252 family)